MEKKNLPACIFCESSVVIIRLSGFRIEYDVLKDGPKSDGIKDVGFLFGGEIDAFGIALESVSV